MVLANQLNSQAPYHTSFINFYAGMLKTPFLGDKLNYILPGGILVFSIVFVVISLVGYESAVVRVIRTGKLKEDKKKEQVTTMLERVYKGEIAILKEIKQQRTAA